MSARASGWIWIAVSAAAFGALGVLVKLGYAEGVDMYAALALRFAVASAILVPVAAVRRTGGISAPVLAGLLLFGGGGYVAHSLCYFTALEYASPGLVGLLLYLYPALVALAGRVLFGERLGGARLAAIAVALAGTALTVGPLGGRLPGIMRSPRLRRDLRGLHRGVLAGRAGREPRDHILGDHRRRRGLVCGNRRRRRSPLPPTVNGWMIVLAMAVISTVIAIVTFFAAMRRIGATSASVGSTLEPLVTVALSFMVLDERLSTTQLLGGAMILAAVAWLATRPPASSP
jgi:drug/metabolite transporter (DMT)-like permease